MAQTFTTGTTGTTTTCPTFTIPSNGFLGYGTTAPSTTFSIAGLGITGYSGIGTTSNLTISSINQNAIMQNRVAVFKVTHNDENKITSTEFIKELWVETKNGQSVEFEVARDKDLAKYKAEDLAIRVILSVTF